MAACSPAMHPHVFQLRICKKAAEWYNHHALAQGRILIWDVTCLDTFRKGGQKCCCSGHVIIVSRDLSDPF